jgi:hypothetical protein
MARKKQETAVAKTDIDSTALQTATAAAGQLGGDYQLIAAQFGYQLTYNRDRMVDEIRHYMGESARTMLEAGARLALIRSQEPHGEWLETCEKLNLEPRTAQRMISTALKFSNATTSSHLERLGTSKLFELLVLDDDDAATLTAGGEIEGLGDLDDISKMTVRELRAALRESRENAGATERVLASKNKKLDQMAAELDRKKNSTPLEEWEWAPVRRTLLDAGENMANFAQTELRRALVDIDEQAESLGEAVPADIVALKGQVLASIMQTLLTLQNEFRLDVDLEAMVTPPWMADSGAADSDKNS